MDTKVEATTQFSVNEPPDPHLEEHSVRQPHRARAVFLVGLLNVLAPDLFERVPVPVVNVLELVVELRGRRDVVLAEHPCSTTTAGKVGFHLVVSDGV